MPTLALLGDVMLGRGVCDQLRTKRPEEFWGDTLPILQSADVVICNLECAVTRCTGRWMKTPKVFHFRADVAAIDVLRAGNIRCVTLANNHTLDFGAEGLLETLRYLDMANIHHAGAGVDASSAAAPAVFDVGGVRIGVISFTDNEEPFAASARQPGTNYMEVKTDEAAMSRLDQWIASARADGAAQFVILSPHWGPNMVQKPPRHHIDFAHEAIERGVDLVFGHSAHIFQGIEQHQAKTILYDAGDFLDDYAIDHELRNDWSFIFMIEIDEHARISGVRLVPVRLSYAQVSLATGDERQCILDRMKKLSEPFGTRFDVTPEGLELVGA